MVKPENFPVFLKGIHIQGFKSFADRVKLELGHGLSVIVGPNGSGKSNVADAVRWVLGEQSAKSLRGVKMEDVIFAGSTQRRPVGMAEVSLIFDNATGIFPLDVLEISEGKQKLSLASKDSETLQSSLVEAQVILGFKESKNLEDKVLLKEIEDDLQRMQGEGFQSEQASDALKHELSIRGERFKYFEEQIARLTDEIQVDEGKIKLLKKRIKTLAAKQAVLKYTVEESQRKVSDQEQKLNVVRESNLAEDIDRIKADLFQ